MRWAMVGAPVEKRARDLLGGEAAHLAQRERHLRVGRQRWMAAREDQPEPVVFQVFVAGRRWLGRLPIQAIGQLGQRGVEPRPSAQAVDGLEAAGRDEPRARVGRHTVARPRSQRRRERVVQRFFGEIEIAEQADERREHAARFGSVDRLDGVPRRIALLENHSLGLGRGHRVPHSALADNSPDLPDSGARGISQIGRTSIEPYFAPGIRDPTLMASFRSLASIR